jgi:hypothetical protein
MAQIRSQWREAPLKQQFSFRGRMVKKYIICTHVKEEVAEVSKERTIRTPVFSSLQRYVS